MRHDDLEFGRHIRSGRKTGSRPGGAALFLLLTALMLVTAPAAVNSAFYAQVGTPVASPDAGTPGATPTAGDETGSLADSVILYSADGMRPDLVEQWAGEGALPTYAELAENGVSGDNGLLQAFPANTGVNWATMATGTYPGEHGALNNTFHRTGDNFADSSSGFEPGILQADTIGHSVERAGGTVVAVEWVGARGYDPALQGPVIDYRSFFSDRGVLTNYEIEGGAEGAERFGVSYQQTELQMADGWSDVPESFSPAMEQTLIVTNTAFPAENNVDRTFELYLYDSTDDDSTNYDGVVIVADGRDGSESVADLGAGEWAEIKVSLTGEREGQTAGFYVKAIDLNDDLSQFRLYYTSIQRVNATFNGCDYAVDCASPLGFEEDLASQLPTAIAADFAPLEAGIVDEATYVEQGLMFEAAQTAYLDHIINELGVSPDLLLLGTPVTDEFSHQFLGLVTPTMQGQPNPYYDDINADGETDGLVEVRTGYVRSAYEMADRFLATAQDLVESANGVQPTTIATSDHGFAPAYYSVDAANVLFQAGLTETLQTINCQPNELPEDAASTPVADDEDAPNVGPRLKVCETGGTAMVYLNVADRDPAGVVSNDEYDTVVAEVIAAFENLSDPENPDLDVVAAVYTKDQTRDIQGSDSLHPSRTGDVVVVLHPPYQFSGAVSGETFVFSEFFGQHGYLPDLVDIENSNTNMHGVFLAAGPGIAQGTEPLAGVHAVDLAPTTAFLLGVQGPRNARGNILYEAVENGADFAELTLLYFNDFHGRITPQSGQTDGFEGEDQASQTASLGGVVALDYWFDMYENEASGTVLRVSGGDTIGATPPLSAFFGDLPSIEFMNLLELDVDVLGNHNFDFGVDYQLDTISPAANFPFLSANVVDAEGNLATEASYTVEIDEVTVGIIGFTTVTTPDLLRADALGPYTIPDPVPYVNEEAARLRSEGAAAIIAVGHEGAASGTFDDPEGRLIDIADQLVGVDILTGAHTNFQTNVVRDNGVLVSQNQDYTLEFSRVRIVLDTTTGQVVHKTADQHRPWGVGIDGDPAIQARIDELNADLQPVLSETIGTSTVYIPRADTCGSEVGRLCESFVGNIVTDAMLNSAPDADFALTNSGGLRADLTCPETDIADDFCAEDAPQNAITRGTVLGVLPFGNLLAQAEVTGAELKEYLEVGVSSIPGESGGFPQVGGLCFTYDSDAEAGNRVTGAFVQNDDGTCSTDAIDLTEGATYLLVTNDFSAAGGDNYPDVSDRVISGAPLDVVVGDYIEAQGELDPTIEGRITCEGSNCPVPVSE